MSLDDAVDLVLYAFANGRQGDTFVQKAPASTIRDLAQALVELFDADNEIKIIGTRHGEKLFESIVDQRGKGPRGRLGRLLSDPPPTIAT